MPVAEPLRIVLADDHAAVRLGVSLALEQGGFRVVAEVPDGPQAVKAALEHRPDLCILDVNMPGGGINAAREIADALPSTPIVMLTVSDADEHLFEALRAGATGYLLKDTDPNRLPVAVKAVLEGEAPLPRVLTARLIREFQRRGRSRRLRDSQGGTVSLSEREAEVLDLMHAELSTEQIARRLGISAVTVRRHVSEVVKKLQVSDRRDLLEFTARAPAA